MVISKRAYLNIFKSGAERGPAAGAAPREPLPRSRAPPLCAARHIRDSPYVRVCAQSSDAEDVIDLGAPRLGRAAPLTSPRRDYVPNPRLYPGPGVQRTRCAAPRAHRRKRVQRWPVPNSRLYRPAAPRPSPPPARPRAAWPPPAPLQPLETASRVALQLRERRQAGGARPQSPLPEPAPSRHLVVTLPAAGGGDSPPAPMDADGNESPSAPSEYLAEFLSAIMRRQYAEALKYCRLILQYEPQNASARGFYPLLVRKVAAAGGEWDGSSGSAGSSGASSPRLRSVGSSSGEESGSCSPLSANTSRSDTDDNGNPLPALALPPDSLGDTDADLENDNTVTAGGGDAALGDARAVHSKTEAGASGATTLQRLRAQFACSIK